jgi:hypothetical protein
MLVVLKDSFEGEAMVLMMVFLKELRRVALKAA